MQHPLKSLEYFQKSYDIRVGQLNEERAKGTKIVGTFCLFVPDEIIFGAGADRIVLCGGRTDTIGLAEQSLPRNICPLIKSSFGAIVDSCCGGSLSCPHVQLVDVAVAEATCDGKKKVYEPLPIIYPLTFWISHRNQAVLRQSPTSSLNCVSSENIWKV